MHVEVEIEGGERSRCVCAKSWPAAACHGSGWPTRLGSACRRWKRRWPAGPFTLATVVRLEDALGTGLREPCACRPCLRAGVDGRICQARRAVAGGSYLTLRPSFSEPGSIFAYLTEICWDDAKGHLVFSEAGRLDSQYEQKGFVSFPNLSGAIYLVTISDGQYRLALLNRPAGGGPISGILVTLAAGQGAADPRCRADCAGADCLPSRSSGCVVRSGDQP
jgi:hypothetical protein